MRYPRPDLIRLVPLGLIALLLLAACQAQSILWQGVLRDADTGAPITHGRAATTGAEVEADGQGQVTLNLTPGEHTLSLSAAGYRSQEIGVLVERKDTGTIAQVALERLMVRGVARDSASGKPLAKVALSLGAASARSDDAGQFTLPADPADSLEASLPGYVPALVPADAWLPLAERGQDLMVTLMPRTLHGILLAQDSGQPLAGVAIQVGEHSTVTDAKGAFELPLVEPGNPVTHGSPAYRPLADVTYQGEPTVTLVLEPWIAALQMRDADTGTPLSGTLVSSPLETQIADAQGALRLRVAPDQPLVVSHAGYATATLTYEGQEALEVALEPSRLTLTLTDGTTGQPITRATVLVPVGEVLAPLPVDAAGRLALENVGTISEITVKAPGYARMTVPITGTGSLALALEPFELRSIYVPFGLLTLPDRITALLDLVSSSELNGIVVDVKSDRARLAWPSQHPLAIEEEAYLDQVMPLEDLLAECRRRNIYTVARLVVFKDDLLAEARPEWAVRREDGSPYVDQENLRWADPFRQEVRDYNIALALEMATTGFDEVQFDYVRFPSDGSTKGLVYQQESNFETRTAALGEFCKQAGLKLAATPAFFSVDIFGLAVWVDPSRDMGIGQRIEDIAPYVDYLCPMFYPQTFGKGNLGFDNPVLHPYEVLYHSVKKTRLRTDTLVRPWLQHYSLFGYTYGVEELLHQKKGAEDAGSAGWTYWNAGGKYNADIFQPGAYNLLQVVPVPPTPTPIPGATPATQ